MTVAHDDRALIEQSQQGDARAFEQLYRRHASAVYGISYRLTLDQRLAEDLTQEAFVQIWRRLGDFRFESAFATWAYRVASNVVLSAMRRERKFTLVDVDYPESGQEMNVLQKIDTEQYLSKLPERARVVLVLHDAAGLTHEEIGEELGIAAGTSKAQLSRARKLFREMAGA